MIDNEIYEEGITEILDLIENVVSIFLRLESDGFIPKNFLEELLRDIHSAKGALGMLGLEKESECVHHLESFIDKAVSQNGLTSGVASLCLEVIYKLQDCLEKREFVDLSPYLGCYSCVERNSFKEVCKSHGKNQKCSPEVASEASIPNKEQPIIKEGLTPTTSLLYDREITYDLILIGFDDDLVSVFSNELQVLSLNCVNVLYRISRKVNCEGFILFNLKSIQVSPFIIIKILEKMCSGVCFVLVAEKSNLLSHSLNDYDEELPSSFLVISDIKKEANRNYLINLAKNKIKEAS